MSPNPMDRVYAWVRYFSNALLIIQVLIVCYMVFARFVLKNSPPWGEEVALLLMVWFCLLSPPEALRDNRHLCISVSQNFLPGPLIRAIDLVNQVLIFGFSIFMMVYGTQLSILTSRNILPGMGVPATVFYLSIPVAGLLLALATAERFVQIWQIPGREYREKGCKD